LPAFVLGFWGLRLRLLGLSGGRDIDAADHEEDGGERPPKLPCHVLLFSALNDDRA
jgi:hypothetical protein